tara:strand:- start:420 stop:734 length:315 start_codon:yes stop_codon:yes gene_type:complete
VLGKNEGYCNCDIKLPDGTFTVGKFHKVKTDDEGWCTLCGHYALKEQVCHFERGIELKGERNFKNSTRAGKNRWNYSYESVWGSQTALTANLTYNTEDEYESKY